MLHLLLENRFCSERFDRTHETGMIYAGSTLLEVTELKNHEWLEHTVTEPPRSTTARIGLDASFGFCIEEVWSSDGRTF